MKVPIGVDDSPHSDAAIHYVTGATWAKTTKFLVLSAVAPTFVGPGETAAADAIARLVSGFVRVREQAASNRNRIIQDSDNLRPASHLSDPPAEGAIIPRAGAGATAIGLRRHRTVPAGWDTDTYTA